MTSKNNFSLPGDFSSRIDTLFARWAKPDSPGAVVTVRHHGEDVHHGLYGMASLAHGVPLTRHSVMRIASQTKQFTVLLALMLESERRLSLEDDIRRHLPWLPAFPKMITLHHLAANVSGLRDYIELFELGGQSELSPCSRRQILDAIRYHAGVNFASGDDLLYCNTGFLLLHEVIEKVSGRSLDELLRERITGPLGMTATRMMPRDDTILPQLVDHHARTADGDWRRAWTGEEKTGDSAIVTSADDMLKWLANMNSPSIGAGELARMTKAGATINNRPSPYGLGLVVTNYRGHRSIGHGGHLAGARSESIRYPDLGLDIVILANADDIDAFSLSRRIVDAALGRPIGPPHSREASARLKAAAGLYHHVETDHVFELTTTEGVPVFRNCDGTRQIEEITPHLFVAERGIFPLQFSLRLDGDIDASWFGHDRLYRRLAPEPLAPDDAWAERYGDDRLGFSAELTIEECETLLKLRSPHGLREDRLRPIAPGLLLAQTDGAWSYVVRIGTDAIIIGTDRTRNLRLPRASPPGRNARPWR